jgi:protein TonB
MGSPDGRAYRRTYQLHDGYRRRNDVFLIALLVSLAVHAATIRLAPGFRRPAFKMAQPMNVLLMPPAPATIPKQPVPAAPPEAAPPPPLPPKPAPAPEADIKPENAPQLGSPQLAVKPEPAPESIPVPKPEPAPKPKPEPKPKPKSEPKPKPKPAPREAVQKTPHRHPAAEPPVHHRTAPAVPASPPSTAVSPLTATPPPQTQPVPSPPVDDLLDRYGKSLARIVAGEQHYPRSAQMRGWQGTVEIKVTVAPPGKADGIAIQRSSGHQVLDDEALNMVKRALPLPEPPGALRERRFTVVVPIVFRLR